MLFSGPCGGWLGKEMGWPRKGDEVAVEDPGLPLAPRHWQDLGYLIIYVTGRPDMQKQRVVAWLAQHNFPHGVVSFCDGLVHDPLRHKANFLKLLISEVGARGRDRAGAGTGRHTVPACPRPRRFRPQLHLRVHAAYGSTKDVAVYSSISLSPMQIYIVGRPTKKLQQQCQVSGRAAVGGTGGRRRLSQAPSVTAAPLPAPPRSSSRMATRPTWPNSSTTTGPGRPATRPPAWPCARAASACLARATSCAPGTTCSAPSRPSPAGLASGTSGRRASRTASSGASAA